MWPTPDFGNPFCRVIIYYQYEPGHQVFQCTWRSLLFWDLSHTVIIVASSGKQKNINPFFFTSVNIEMIPLLFTVRTGVDRRLLEVDVFFLPNGRGRAHLFYTHVEIAAATDTNQKRQQSAFVHSRYLFRATCFRFMLWFGHGGTGFKSDQKWLLLQLHYAQARTVSESRYTVCTLKQLHPPRRTSRRWHEPVEIKGILA